MDEEELDRLAAEELLREAKQGAARAVVHGALGWKKDAVPRTNKRFLCTTLAHTMQYNYRRSRSHSRSRSRSPTHTHSHSRSSSSSKHHTSHRMLSRSSHHRHKLSNHDKSRAAKHPRGHKDKNHKSSERYTGEKNDKSRYTSDSAVECSNEKSFRHAIRRRKRSQSH